MNPRNALCARGICLWTGLGASALLGLVFIGSAFRSVYWSGDTRRILGIQVDRGMLEATFMRGAAASGPLLPPTGFVVSRVQHPALRLLPPLGWVAPGTAYAHGRHFEEQIITIPLWVPWCFVLAATAWLGWRHWGTHAPGLCGQCGYRLAGLPAGDRCPECGFPGASAQHSAGEATGATPDTALRVVGGARQSL
jgi:hypothetical protein